MALPVQATRIAGSDGLTSPKQFGHKNHKTCPVESYFEQTIPPKKGQTWANRGSFFHGWNGPQTDWSLWGLHYTTLKFGDF